ncbi:hypothetical protein PPROV_000171600 [Pycnococcus provasolii]|uniref:RIIa domain-containing protein n=1 Tax=Pycnococcus provasolii TaxID=41880 RepID=A0A830HBJ0_9CHLO|nr:hypothetical protein PPROV_000171600 [Pycnococcus provasolii]
MDVEPIYMAEQIRVPPDLADILKAYTKEVIRRQPEDLYEFSAIYFANLANVSQSLEDFVPPAVDELRVVWSQLKAFETIDTPQFVEFCRSAGLSESTLAKVLSLAQVANDSITPKEAVVLLVTMVGESFKAFIGDVFEVFGENGKLPKGEIIEILGILAKKDAEIPPSFVDDLTAELEELEELSLDELLEIPGVKALTETLAGGV